MAAGVRLRSSGLITSALVSSGSITRMSVFLSAMGFMRDALVVLFVGVSLAILVAGVLRRLKFNHVRLSWPTGRLFGLPLAPTLFLAAVLGLIAFSLTTGQNLLSIGWLAATGYVVGGLCWYAGALLCGSTIVTDWGISAKVDRDHRMLPWHEITDYVVKQHARRADYVFFTLDAQGQKRRVEVRVPGGIRDRFGSIVEFRLDTRFDRSMQRSMGPQALEQ